jgi:methionine synthase II (cobalamin-independent)
MAAAAGRGAQRGDQRLAAGPHPLPRLLGQLARPAHHRRGAQGYRRSHPRHGANPRHEHEWRVWESAKLPKDKVLIPGVISHATNVVEHPELVAERIVRLAKLVGHENVLAGTDCGFAQGPFHRRVHPSIMWAKLDALVQGAKIASKELWK